MLVEWKSSLGEEGILDVLVDSAKKLVVVVVKVVLTTGISAAKEVVELAIKHYCIYSGW